MSYTDLEALTLRELRAIAKKLGVQPTDNLKRAWIEAILSANSSSLSGSRY